MFVEAEPWNTPTNLESKEGWLYLGRQIIEGLDQGNYHSFLDALIEQLELRNEQAIVTNSFERRIAHENLRPLVISLRQAVRAEPAASEIALPAQRPFTAKCQVRELLEQATTEVLLVDPYIGIATVDCFRLVTTPARILPADGSKGDRGRI